MKNRQIFDTIFQAIFLENGASGRPKWPPKPPQNHQKIILKSRRFFNTILACFLHDFGSTFDPKILPKMIKTHFGIDLEPQNQEVKKMAPLQSFLLVFLVPRGAEKHTKIKKKRFQDAYKKLSTFSTDFE